MCASRRRAPNRMSAPSPAPDPVTELSKALDALAGRWDKLIDPITKDIERAEELLDDGAVDKAHRLYNRAARRVSAMSRAAGLKALDIMDTPNTPTVDAPTKWSRVTKFLKLSSVLLFAAAMTGCGTTTKFLQFRELEKVEKAKVELKKNEDERLAKGRDFVYGTGKALEQVPSTDPEVKLAKLLNERALLTLGTPSSKDAIKLKQMVDDLLSVNEEIHKKGLAELENRDSAIADLEAKTKDLERKLAIQEEKRDDKFEDAALKAAKWDDENSFLNSINPFRDLAKFAKKLVFLILFVLFICAGVKIGALFFPPLAPFSAILDSIVGGIFKMGFRAMPAAKAAAGVVATEAHQLSEQTLAAMVKTVQDLRYDHGPEVKATVEKVLWEHHTDDGATEAKVRAVKDELRKGGTEV